jgi:hypothetical protein
MPYALSLESRGGYLHARVTGSGNQQTVLDYTQEIHNACIERDLRAVLIEENLSGPSISLSAVLQIVAERAPQAVKLLKRIALVDLNPEHNPSHLEFAENAAANRGLNLRLFPSVGAAQKWLQETPASGKDASAG